MHDLVRKASNGRRTNGGPLGRGDILCTCPGIGVHADPNAPDAVVRNAVHGRVFG